MTETPNEAALEEASVDLPDHLTVGDLVEAVAEADTLYEVQREARVQRTILKRLCFHLEIGDHLRQQQGQPATADPTGGQADD